jgi:hypothetical protein
MERRENRFLCIKEDEMSAVVQNTFTKGGTTDPALYVVQRLAPLRADGHRRYNSIFFLPELSS